VNPLDVIKEQADATLHDEDERFDADFALMAGELAGLLTDLTALGGERKAEGAPPIGRPKGRLIPRAPSAGRRAQSSVSTTRVACSPARRQTSATADICASSNSVPRSPSLAQARMSSTSVFYIRARRMVGRPQPMSCQAVRVAQRRRR
jgi:hypothetical protein